MTLARGQLPLAKPDAFMAMKCVCTFTRRDHMSGSVMAVALEDHSFTPIDYPPPVAIVLDVDAEIGIAGTRYIHHVPDCIRCADATDVATGNVGLPMTSQRMFVCPTCGNKRCPKANDHDHACTGSNEPGQPGSAYPIWTPPTDARRAEMVAEDQPERVPARGRRL